MAHPTARSGPGRINGLQRGGRTRNLRARVRSIPHLHLVALGSGLYTIALLFPLVWKQVTAAVVLAALVGTGLLLLGLHLRWTRGGRQ